MKRKDLWQLVEFSFGFAVLCNGKRVALCADEDDAKRVMRRGKRASR